MVFKTAVRRQSSNSLRTFTAVVTYHREQSLLKAVHETVPQHSSHTLRRRFTFLWTMLQHQAGVTSVWSVSCLAPLHFIPDCNPAVEHHIACNDLTFMHPHALTDERFIACVQPRQTASPCVMATDEAEAE